MSLCVRGSTADQSGLAGKRKMKCKECPVVFGMALSSGLS